MIRLPKRAVDWPGAYEVLHDHPGIEYRFKFACPAPLCFYTGMYATEALRDERAANHPCPWFGGGHTTFSWGIMSDEYITPIWKKLDEQVAIIKSDGADVVIAKAKARAFAEALAVLMPPFFTTADDVVKESLRRWGETQAGREPETPGIGRLKWKRPDLNGVDPSRPSWMTSEYDPNNKIAPKHNLDAEQVEAIKKAKGLMPVPMIAAAYGTTAEVVKHFWEQ